jgi:hypothetical protein
LLEGSVHVQLLSTHPPVEHRAEAIRAYALEKALPATTPHGGSDEAAVKSGPSGA